MGAPPPVVQMILDADITPDHFEGVTAYMTSSAAIPPDTIRRFEQRYGIPVLLGYGATEFLNSVSGWTPALWSEFGATKVGSVGRALPGRAAAGARPRHARRAAAWARRASSRSIRHSAPVTCRRAGCAPPTGRASTPTASSGSSGAPTT